MADHEQVNSKLITYDQLAENFHLPINEVSKKLGICTTVLKKVCRRNGIPRWPYRKLKALDKKISNLKTSLQKNPQESKRIHAEIVALQERKRLIMENPSCLSVETTEQTFDEVYDDLNSSALLLSLTPSRDQAPTPEPRSTQPSPPPPKVPRVLSFTASRTEEEEEELLVASNLVEMMSQQTFGAEPAQQQTKEPSFYNRAPTAPPLFTSSHPPFSPVPSFPPSSASPPPASLMSTATTRPSSASPPPFPNMPMINPRSFFSAEERAPPIPHSQPVKVGVSPPPTPNPRPPARGHLRSFSSAPMLEALCDEQQPPLPSWFSRSLEEAVNSGENSRPDTPSGHKRAGRDVETLEAESRTQNSLTTKRSRNESPNLQALGLPSLLSSVLKVAPSTSP